MKNTNGKLEHKLIHIVPTLPSMKAQLAAFMKQIWTACN